MTAIELIHALRKVDHKDKTVMYGHPVPSDVTLIEVSEVRELDDKQPIIGLWNLKTTIIWKI